MNFKKIIAATLVLSSLGAVTAIASTRLSQGSNGWSSPNYFDKAHTHALHAGFTKCNLNDDHSSKVGRYSNGITTFGEASSSATSSRSYLQSAIKVNGSTSKGYTGNKSSYKKSPTMTGRHTAYEGHNGYIK
ncbi:MAG: hypothetical protein ACRCWG_13440 [Sarcina sp.]